MTGGRTMTDKIAAVAGGIRIARRANTIASLARVISERKVSSGLRKTLLTQARRLENDRLKELGHLADDDETNEVE